MYKIFFIISFLCFGLSTAFAHDFDNTLSGRIKDAKTQQPLVGATVYIPDLKTGGVTDREGRFKVTNLPGGTFLVQVQYVGYSSATKMVLIKGDTHHDFLMTTSILEQDEVVVTGMSRASEARKSPTPIDVIQMKQIQRHTYTNIINAIAKQPGINEISTGPAVSKPVIRGLSYNRVVVVNDGIRQEGQQWGDEHGIEVDDYNVNKIEILKGPASLMYGSDALAGVVNITSNQPVPEGTVNGNLTGSFQSNSGLFGFHGNVAGNLDGINWNVYGTHQQSHDYHNKYDGYVFDSRFNETNYGGYIGLNKSWGYSHLQFASFNENLGLVEGDRDSLGRFIKPVDNNGNSEEAVATDGDFHSYSPQIPRQHVTHNKWILDNNFYLSDNSRLGVILGYQQSLRKEFGEVTAAQTPGLFLQLNTFNYDLKYFLPEMKGWQTTIGVNGMQQNNKNKGEEFLIPDYGLFDIGAFGYVKKSFDRFNLSAGIRFDSRSVNADGLYTDDDGKPVPAGNAGAKEKFSDFHRRFSNVSGSAGFSYEASHSLTLKFNAARGFRAPNLAELSANGVHEGTIRYEYGNLHLRPEVSTEADAGMEWSSRHVSLNASLFYNYIQHYIYSRKLVDAQGGDSIPAIDNEENYAAFQYTQTNARLYGGEVVVDVHPHPLDWLHFENTFSIVKGRISGGTDSTRYLPMMPAPRWICELRGNFEKAGKLFRNVYASLEWDQNFDQHEIFSAYKTETSTAGYGLLDFGLGADIVNRHAQTLFSVHLSANNMLDVAYQNHLNRLKYAAENPVTGRAGVFNMGRNFSVKVNIPLRFK